MPRRCSASRARPSGDRLADLDRDLSRRQIVRSLATALRARPLVVAAAGKVDHDRLVERLCRDGHCPPARTPAGRGRHRRTVPARGGLSRAPSTTRTVQRRAGIPGSGRLRRPPLSARAALPDRRRRDGVPAVRRGAGAARPDLQHRCRARQPIPTPGLWSVEWQCSPGELPEISRSYAGCSPTLPRTASPKRAGPGQRSDAWPDSALVRGPVSRMGRLGQTRCSATNAPSGDPGALRGGHRRQVRAEAAALFAQPPLLAVVGPKFDRRRIIRLLG